MQVTFLPDHIQHTAEQGDNLMAIAARAGVLIDGNCGSSGKCGRCRVQILSGKVPPPYQAELKALTESELKDGFRLACHIHVEGDLCINVPQINSAKGRKTKMMALLKDYNLGSSTEKYFITIGNASLDHQKDDLCRIFSALEGKGSAIAPESILLIPSVLKQSNNRITAVVRDGLIIGLEPGDTTERKYGLAFDIGTTTVAGMLWDLNKGEMLGITARTNPQNIYGADVISRIHSIMADHDTLLQMKLKIRDCFNDIIKELTRQNDISQHELYDVTVVGNTTMSHLFLGADPAQLAMAPFVPVFCDSVEQTGRSAELKVHPLARVLLLPNIAGHVGSDIVAVILASDLAEQTGLRLAIDIGTNGEIVLSKDRIMLACSTAAGPAFEGASIYQGMRASQGAIESVHIQNDEVLLEIIDSKKPAGICGSGLIDTVAQLLDAGFLDARGRLLDQKTAKEKNLPETLIQRLRDGENCREFILARGTKNDPDIVITQKDIREVQLAKGAIYAGIVIMLRELGSEMEDIETITLAGAFGNYIKKESALRIGLLPDIPIDHIISAGNAAGSGACLALLSREEREKALVFSRRVRHVELAVHPEFQAEFLKSMYFPDRRAAL
jgi:uncharacterized 2Fe-2S/4Fe-4S cluster protein (DUF4445 family)